MGLIAKLKFDLIQVGQGIFNFQPGKLLLLLLTILQL
jgi:hypothetical protein